MSCLLAGPLRAQGTLADYLRAERFTAAQAATLASHLQVQPVWLDGARFWFEDRTPAGRQWIVVDAAANTQRPFLDPARLAQALTAAADTAVDPATMTLPGLAVSGDLRTIRFRRGKAWMNCELAGYTCAPADTARIKLEHESLSPDSTLVVWHENGNLWARRLATGERFQLTTDGTPDNAYGAHFDPTAKVTMKRLGLRFGPVLRWSPDGSKILTLRVDERGVESLAVIEPKQGRPVVHTFPYAMAGDSVVPRVTYHLIDVATRRSTPVDRPPHAGDVLLFGASTEAGWPRARWSNDGTRAWILVGARGDKQYELVEVDAATGRTRTVLTERRATQVDLHPFIGGAVWRPVGDQHLWYSERDGWAHLYRIDGASGAVRNRLTDGPWMVSDIEHVDEAAGLVYFTARGREAGRNPYHRILYRVNLDGTGLTMLTPEEGDHTISTGPGGRYFVDTRSAVDLPPVTVVRDRTGRVVREVARADLSGLAALGWRMPRAFTVKARDGVTDLHGVMYLPSNFDSTAAYPIVDYIYPGPQIGPMGLHSFALGGGGNGQALAELGFVVVAFDALGAPFRNKAFHDSYYGRMGDNGIPDHVAAIRQLAARHRFVDIERVGIYGHSGGGYSSARAMLMYPDFFKVAVSSAGNFDQRGYTYLWGEKYQGLMERKDGGDNYANQDVQSLAGNLKGKLMLVYGEVDDNVPPNLTLVLIDALIKANKNFDLLVMPYGNHGFAADPYFIRRQWDFLVKHLLGVEPPEGFRLALPGS
ncbi:MAG: DPP IV N-terminal domain-containing protein [Gemmatimonadales bacterium]